jgi:multiple sugar transport system permease protein
MIPPPPPPPPKAGRAAPADTAPPLISGEAAVSWTPLILLVLLAGSVVMAAPLVWLTLNSLRTDEAIQRHPTGLPEQWLWGNYALALDRIDFANTAANTIVITALCLVGQVLSSSLVGYGFARFRFRFREPIFLLMLSTMMLPAQVTMIPVFVLFQRAGLIDTFWPLIIPAWLGSPFFIFMFRQFFAQLPRELDEAAHVDGAGPLRIYFRIMLPLSWPVIAIAAIYTFMTTWNDFMGPLIYINSPERATLSLALANFNSQYGTRDPQLLMAASVVTMLPCVALFFVAQRFFMRGIAMTGLKG